MAYFRSAPGLSDAVRVTSPSTRKDLLLQFFVLKPCIHNHPSLTSRTIKFLGAYIIFITGLLNMTCSHSNYMYTCYCSP